jgi:acyl carrier protein
VTDSEILMGIREVVRMHLNVDREIVADTALAEALALDSLARITLVAELENRFRVCFEDGDEADLVTVADVIAVLRRRLA